MTSDIFCSKSTWLLFLSLVNVVEMELCPTWNLDANLASLPPPPKFPDFLTAFENTIILIGMPDFRLIENGSTLSKCCALSVNWSDFHSRRCDDEPFDLDEFCKSSPTSEITTATTYLETFVEITTGSSFEISTTNMDTNDDNTSQIPEEEVVTDSSPIEMSHLPDSDFSNSSDLSHAILPLPVNGSTSVAEAVYQGDGASVAIGVGCGLTLLFIIIIVVIISASQPGDNNSRNPECWPMMNPLFKVFQRQTSDARPFTYSFSNQPTTPLEEFHPSGLQLNNMVAEVQWTDEEKNLSSCLQVNLPENENNDHHQPTLLTASDLPNSVGTRSSHPATPNRVIRRKENPNSDEIKSDEECVFNSKSITGKNNNVSPSDEFRSWMSFIGDRENLDEGSKWGLNENIVEERLQSSKKPCIKVFCK